MNKKTENLLLQKVVEDYNNIADQFHETRKRSWKEFSYFLKYINDNEKIADLGCGNGRFYSFIKKHKNINYVGIDNNKNLLKKAEKNNKNIKFIYGNLLKIPIKTNAIDVAIAIASFHHIPGKDLRKKVLEEIKRILKPKGKLIISVWNLFQQKYKKYIWKARLKHLLSLGKYDSRDTFIPWGKTGTNRYYYAFRPEELKKLLNESGFKIIKKKTDNNIIFICEKQ